MQIECQVSRIAKIPPAFTAKLTEETGRLQWRRYSLYQATDSSGKTAFFVVSNTWINRVITSAMKLLGHGDTEENFQVRHDFRSLKPIEISLTDVCRVGHLTAVKNLLKRPTCNVNEALRSDDQAGITPLWLAATLGHLEIAQELIKRPECNVNAAPTILGEENKTPLWQAAKNCHWDIVRELLMRPQCEYRGDPDGRLLLFMPVMHGRKDIALEILKHPSCTSFHKVVEAFLFDNDRLPYEDNERICLAFIRSTFPFLSGVEDKEIRLVITAICDSISAKRLPKAADWFSKRAFAWCKQKNVAIDPGLAKFSDFKKSWEQSLQQFLSQHFVIINRQFRNDLFAAFTHAAHPLASSQFSELIMRSCTSVSLADS